MTILMTPGSDSPPDLANTTLSGYDHHELPDLSANRFPHGTFHTLSASFNELLSDACGAPADEYFRATIISAAGRVIGAYGGAADILIGLQTVDPDCTSLPRPVRVRWDSDTSWIKIIRSVAQNLDHGDRSQRIPPEILRRSLGLNKQQTPFAARVLLSSHEDDLSIFPERIAFAITPSCLYACASDKYVHPSVLEVLLYQVIAFASHALANQNSKVAFLPHLSPQLRSSYEKLSLEKRRLVYSHVPSVPVATDHLALRASSQPDDIAVKWYPNLAKMPMRFKSQPETITYEGLHNKANQTARWLIRMGLSKGEKVAVCMNRDIWFHVSLIAILRAGGCYVPIDPELPLERRTFIVQDSNARFVLSSSLLPSHASLGPVALDISARSVQDSIDQESESNLDTATSDDVAYLLYTSGTTGTPKGCILTHKGLSEAIWGLSYFCDQASLSMPRRQEGNYLSIASIAFDVHLAEIFVALATALPILSAPRTTLLEDLPYFIRELRISHVGIVPSLIEATMGAAQEDEDAGHGTTLRYIASGGEKMTDAILDKWGNHPIIRLANFYGPSEVTIGCAARFMDKVTPRANIGRPFANVSAYVVDENLQIVPRGCPGELVVEGPLVGLGYHGLPDLTKKVFMEFPEDHKGRWAYRTGDLVRMMPDSTLEVLGRIDSQIKLRGVRIESEGISSIVRSAAIPDIDLDVLTILTKHPTIAVEQLVSFIAWDRSVSVAVRRSSTRPTLTKPPPGLLRRIRSACETELANYMRPSHIIPMSWIPLSSNGKADAKVLAAVFHALDMDILSRLISYDDDDGPTNGHLAEPRVATAMEQRVLEVARKHIKVPVKLLGPDTNLFECGIDSIGSAKFASDLRRSLPSKVNISAADILNAPVVRDIAKKLEQQDTDIPNGKKTLDAFTSTWKQEVDKALPDLQVESVFPAFPLQEGTLYRSENSNTKYVQHVIMRFGPNTSAEKVEEAWKTLIHCHEILRTIFYFGKDLVQVVLRPDSCPFRLSEKDIHLEETSEEGFLSYFNSEEASSIATDINTCLTSVPPSRLTLYRSRQSSSSYMVLSLHHAIFDGISLPIILQDLECEYLQSSPGLSPPMSEIISQIVSLDLGAARTFWKKHFAGYQWDGSSPRYASSPDASVISIPFKTSLSGLQAKAAAHRVTLQAFLMSGFAHLLATRFYERDDVVFGIIHSGRFLPVENVETALCPLITVLPARVNFHDSKDVAESIQEYLSEVVNIEHISLSKIQRWVGSGAGLFEVLFSISLKDKSGSTLWEVIESKNPEQDYILAVEVVLDPTEDSLSVQASYSPIDLSPAMVNDIICSLEPSTMETSGRSSLHTNSLTPLAKRGNYPQVPRIESSLENIEDQTYDEEIFRKIGSTIAGFLHIDPNLITKDSSLIALGMDSIRSVGLSRALRQEGLSFSSADIMKLDTPRKMASFATESKHATPQLKDRQKEVDWSFQQRCQMLEQHLDLKGLKLSPDDVIEVLPTTVLQAGMLTQTISSGGRSYVHAFPLRVSKALDIQRLREAWKQAVSFFAILRTTFHFVADVGLWAAAVHSVPDFKWSTIVHNDAQSQMDDLIGSICVDEGGIVRPPFHLFLLQNTRERHGDDILVLVMHHALYDGLSVSKLIDAAHVLYRGEQLPSQLQFSAILPQVIWQETKGAEFWIQKLRDYRPAQIPRLQGAFPDGELSSYVASRNVRIEKLRLQELCRKCAVTFQCVGQLAYAKVLASLVKSSDVLFGHVISGRNVPGAEDVVGPVLNTIPCRVTLVQDMSNAALLKIIHRNNVDAIPWQQASLRAIQQGLEVRSLLECLFVFQPYQDSATHEADLPWAFDDAESKARVHYPLNVELHETADGLLVKGACSADSMNRSQFDDLLEQYAAFIVDIVEKTELPWSSGVTDMFNEDGVRSLDQDRKSAIDPTVAEGQWDKTSSLIRDLLASITKIAPANIHQSTDLASLGIDSITAIQIVARGRKLGLHVSAVDVINSRTLRDLTQKVTIEEVSRPNGTNMSREPGGPKVSPEQAADILTQLGDRAQQDVQDISVPTAGMQWLIAAWQQSDGARFQHTFGYRLPSDVNVTRLREAWNKLLLKHTILRSTFVCSKSGDLFVVTYKPKILGPRWVEKELNVSRNENPEEKVRAEMKALVSNPPSMKKPMTHAYLLRNRPSQFLVLHLHHFQYDAWSLQLLLDDLYRLYEGAEPISSDKGWHELCIFSQPDNTTIQQTYWKHAFPPDFRPTLFPSLWGSSRRGPQNTRPRRHRVYIKSDAILGASQLEACARSQSVSLQAILLASWARVQAMYTSAGSSTFGLWHSGRGLNIADIDKLAVPCMNVLPLHVPNSCENASINLAQRIYEDLKARSGIVEQSELMRVHEWIGITDTPICNVFVNIIKIAPEVDDGIGTIFAPISVPHGIPDVNARLNLSRGKAKLTDLLQDDIMIDMFILNGADTVGMSIEFAEALMTEEDAKRVVARWAEVVNGFLPNRVVSEKHVSIKKGKIKRCIIF